MLVLVFKTPVCDHSDILITTIYILTLIGREIKFDFFNP